MNYFIYTSRYQENVTVRTTNEQLILVAVKGSQIYIILWGWHIQCYLDEEVAIYREMNWTINKNFKGDLGA